MALLELWLENGSTRTRLRVDEHMPAADLVDELLAKSTLPRTGADGRPLRYEALNLRTERVLRRSSEPVSEVVREGDVFRMQASPRVEPAGFNLTGVPPLSMDRSTSYPVLAIRATCSLAGDSRLGARRLAGVFGSVVFNGRPILAKEVCFLVADRDGRPKWVSPNEAVLHQPGLAGPSGPQVRLRATHYSLEDETEENTDMIYPVRPFSITSVSLDGFDANKEYPVLAIDVDRYLPEEETEEAAGPAQPESLAFFLVGDDRGEFAWIGEDQCRLAPLRE